MHFHNHTFYVVPLGGDRYWYANGADDENHGPDLIEKKAGYVVSKYLVDDATRLFLKGGSDLVEGHFYGTRADEAFVTGTGWSDQVNDVGRPRVDGTPLCSPYMEAEVELRSMTGPQMGGVSGMPFGNPQVTTLYSLATNQAVFSIAVYEGTVSIDRARQRED